MREIISLYVGQAGVQIGDANWEQICVEHSIDENGNMMQPPQDVEHLDSFFSISPAEKLIPRCLMIDLESMVIDEIRNGRYRMLFNPRLLINGSEDAANNFARGFFTTGKTLLHRIKSEFRRMLEGCNHVYSIMFYRALGGGTGSGLTSAILDYVAEYTKITKIDVPIYPSEHMSLSTVEPYNGILAHHFSMEDIDVGLLFDNEALFKISEDHLKSPQASFSSINRLLAQVNSNMTASVRFENTLSSDLNVLQNNLIPYPRIHFLLTSFAPIHPIGDGEKNQLTVSDLTRQLFSPDNRMLKIDTLVGRNISCAINYRGCVSPYDVFAALKEVKQDKFIEFVDWCPTGFRVGINNFPPVFNPNGNLDSSKMNALLFNNSTTVGQAWHLLVSKFSHLYKKRSFIYWYVSEGMEECEFIEAYLNITSLISDYKECELPTEQVENKMKEKLKSYECATSPKSLHDEEKRECSELRVPESLKSKSKSRSRSRDAVSIEDDCVNFKQDLISNRSKDGNESNINLVSNYDYNTSNNCLQQILNAFPENNRLYEDDDEIFEDNYDNFKDNYDNFEDDYDNFKNNDDNFENNDDNFEDDDNNFENNYDNFEDDDDNFKNNDDKFENNDDNFEDNDDNFENNNDNFEDDDDNFEDDNDNFENNNDNFEDDDDNFEDDDDNFEDALEYIGY